MEFRLDHHRAHRLADGLGWFSIGLGLAELIAPRSLGRLLGMEEHSRLIRACGARELIAGIGILAQADPRPWLWSRVGGDMLDLGALALGLRPSNPRRGNVSLAIVAVAGVTALDVLCAQALGSDRAGDRRRQPAVDYSGRRGMPRPPEAMRGAAHDFEIPSDLRVPEAMRPYPA